MMLTDRTFAQVRAACAAAAAATTIHAAFPRGQRLAVRHARAGAVRGALTDAPDRLTRQRGQA